MALKKFRVSYSIFWMLFMERARQLNLVPGDILFRKVFCFTRKDGDCWVHCVARVPVHLPE